MESYLKAAGMAGLASAWAMARRRPKEYRLKVDAAKRCSGVCPHTLPDLKFYNHITNVATTNSNVSLYRLFLDANLVSSQN